MNVPVTAAAALVLFSFYFLLYAIGNYRKSLASKSWPSTRGKILELKLWGKRRIDDEMQDADHLAIKYQYRVNESNYVGSKVAFYTLAYPETIDFALSHPEGSSVTVHYDPDKIETSVLLTGPRNSKRYSEIILSLVGIVAGIIVMILN